MQFLPGRDAQPGRLDVDVARALDRLPAKRPGEKSRDAMTSRVAKVRWAKLINQEMG